MSQANIDHDEARKVLRSAITAGKSASYTPTHPKHHAIAEVMLGTHLTYRYILFTNLLAKATNAAANGIALQAGAALKGAFDSRSLCHKVVVDFDRDAGQLAGKLGRSNEPYLNKPARYTTLSTENAVRRGYDRGILETSIDILEGLQNAADARAALEDAVYYTMQRESLIVDAVELESDASLHKVLSNFAAAAVKNSNEGESCAILTGLAFFMLGQSDGREYDIQLHPSNQAGSSSREVLDVDVYVAGVGLIHTAEVKDKVFNFNDVDHAASKVKSAGLDRFFFICGPQSGGAVAGSQFIDAIADSGVKVSFVDVGQFLATALGFAPSNLEAVDVWAFIDASMRAARVKDATRAHIIESARAAGLVGG